MWKKKKGHGGRRPGAGRKRKHSPGVAHRERQTVTRRTPLHINFKYRVEIKNKTCLKLLKRAVLNSRKKDLRVIHFSLQYNHIHLIVEAENNDVLERGMRSLLVTFAKGLKKGRVQLERYHLHVLRSIRETRNALHYVLFNTQKHSRGRYSRVDEYSSLLNHPHALNLIKAYVTKHKVTIEVKRASADFLEQAKSYVLVCASGSS